MYCVLPWPQTQGGAGPGNVDDRPPPLAHCVTNYHAELREAMTTQLYSAAPR